MAYPTDLTAAAGIAARSDATTMATNHAADHNAMVDAFVEVLAELGTNPSLGSADVSTRIAKEVLEYALSDETTAITTGTNKLRVRAPYAFTLDAVRASVGTASSSGLPTVDINKNSTTVLSTKLTIDANEKTSVTAATAAVISVSAFADDDEIEFDIDVAGTGATGLKVTLYVTRTS